MCTRGQSVFSYKHLHKGVQTQNWVRVILWGFLLSTAAGTAAPGVVKIPMGKWVWRETKLQRHDGNELGFCRSFFRTNVCQGGTSEWRSSAEWVVSHGGPSTLVYEIVIKFLILTNVNTSNFIKCIYINTHIHTHLYTHIHICMINTHTYIFKLPKKLHQSLQSRLKLWRVVVALKTRDSLNRNHLRSLLLCLHLTWLKSVLQFMCQQTDLFHKTVRDHAACSPT